MKVDMQVPYEEMKVGTAFGMAVVKVKVTVTENRKSLFIHVVALFL